MEHELCRRRVTLMTARNKSASGACAMKLSARDLVFRMRIVGEGRVIYADGQKVRDVFRQLREGANNIAR
jgi:hypothetical protein